VLLFIHDLREVKRLVEEDCQSSGMALNNTSGSGPGNNKNQTTERHGPNAQHQTGKCYPDKRNRFPIGHMYANGSLGRLECERIDVSHPLDDDCPNGCTDENKDAADEGGHSGYVYAKRLVPVWNKSW